MAFRVVLAAESRGSAEILAPLAGELMLRNMEVVMLGLGTALERKGFGLRHVFSVTDKSEISLSSWPTNCQLLITGLTGRHSAEVALCRLARARGIFCVGILDNVDGLEVRLHPDASALPHIILICSSKDDGLHVGFALATD